MRSLETRRALSKLSSACCCPRRTCEHICVGSLPRVWRVSSLVHVLTCTKYPQWYKRAGSLQFVGGVVIIFQQNNHHKQKSPYRVLFRIFACKCIQALRAGALCSTTSMHKFWKVSALTYLLQKGTINGTFQNFRRFCIPLSCFSKNCSCYRTLQKFWKVSNWRELASSRNLSR